MASKVLIIVGMHRSGTSLITQWLYCCGLYIGKKLLPAGVGNIEGHFEDSDFLNAHVRFLLKRKLPSSGFVDKPVRKLTIPEKQQLKDMIESKSRENKEWGWKEPRTCLFLNEYKELIPSAFYLFIFRDYYSTVNSMLLRDCKLHIKRFETKKGLSRLKWILFKKKNSEQIFKKQAETFLRIWIYYYEQILNQVQSLPDERYMLVHYSSLVQNDRDVFARIKNDWQFSLEYFPFTSVFKKELLSEVREIEQYIKDKELITKAKEIENAINEFFIIHNRCIASA